MLSIDLGLRMWTENFLLNTVLPLKHVNEKVWQSLKLLKLLKESCHRHLTPQIPGPCLPISTSKMLKFSKKSQKNLKNLKMLKFHHHKDYDLSNLLKKSCQKIKNPNCGSLPKFLQPTLGFVEF
jgi:hypothetical protein